MVACILSLLTGCEKKETGDQQATSVSSSRQKGGLVIGSVNGVPLYKDEYEKQAFYFNPLSRLRSNIPEDRMKAMVEAELLWQEANRQAIAERPTIRRQIQQIVINALIEEAVLSTGTANAVNEEDIEKFYQEHIDRYRSPARVRVAHLQLQSGDVEAGKKMLEDPLILQPGGFSRLVRNSSVDKNSSIRGGDLGYVEVPSEDGGKSKEGDESGNWQLVLAKAAMSIPRIGGIYPELVETDQGLHIVKLTGREVEKNYSLDQVKNKIALQLSSEGNAKLYRQYVESLAGKVEIQTPQEEELMAMLDSAISDRETSNPVEEEREKAVSQMDVTRLPDRHNLSASPVTWQPGAASAANARKSDGDITIEAIDVQKARNRPPIAPANIESAGIAKETPAESPSEDKGGFDVNVTAEETVVNETPAAAEETKE